MRRFGGPGPAAAKASLLIGACGLGAFAYLLDKTPVTGRWRLLLFDHQMARELADVAHQEIMEQYQEQLLPDDHGDVALVSAIAKASGHVNRVTGTMA